MPLVIVSKTTIVTANKVAPIYRFPTNLTNAGQLATITSSANIELSYNYGHQRVTTNNLDITSKINGNVNNISLTYGSVAISSGNLASVYSIKNFCDNYSPLSLLKISGHITGADVGDWYSSTNWSAAGTGIKDGITSLNMTVATTVGAQLTTSRTILLPQNYTLFYVWYPNENDTNDRTLHRGTYEILAKMQAGTIPRLGAYSDAFGTAASDYTGYRLEKKWQTLIVVGYGPTSTSRLGVQQYYVDGRYVGQVRVVGSGTNINKLGSSSTGFMNPPGHIREAGILGQALNHNEIVNLNLRLSYTFNPTLTGVAGVFYSTPSSALKFGLNSLFANTYVSSNQMSQTNFSVVNPINSQITYKKTRIINWQSRFLVTYPVTQITIVINGFSPVIPNAIGTPTSPSLPTSPTVPTLSSKQYWF